MMRHIFNRKSGKSYRSSPPEPAAADNDNVLPLWDLNSLYPGTSSKQLFDDERQAEALTDAFQQRYQGKVGSLSGAELGFAVAAYEKIEILRQKISCYATLLEREDSDSTVRTGEIRKWEEILLERLDFFEAEISDLPEKDLMTRLVAPELAKYAPWIAHVRFNNSHLLSGEVEAMSQSLSIVNRSAWARLYRDTMADIQVDLDDEKLDLQTMRALADDGEATLDDRRWARQKIAEALKANSRRVAFIYNTIIKDDMIDADLRGYVRADQEVNMQNGLDPKVVDAMHDTVQRSYSRLSHRFHAWKAAQHGVPVMDSVLYRSSVPGTGGEETGVYAYGDARRAVLRAFRKFSPRFSRIAQRLLDERHVDLDIREGKDDGGYSMPVGPGVLPFISMTYTGTVESVVAGLGHELGHGIHQTLAGKACGLFLADVPITTAETASVFAEMLVFNELLQQEKDPELRKKLLVERADNMLGNGLQQLSFYDFERRVHAERRNGELSVERICDIWIDTQKQYCGPSVEFDECDRYYWMTISHFYDTPFYVYSYSFAQQLVNGLYQNYREAEQKGPAARDAFVAHYTALLESGMTKNLREALKPFGLDPEAPGFWENGLSLAGKYIDELERLYPFQKPAPAVPKPPKPPGA